MKKPLRSDKNQKRFKRERAKGTFFFRAGSVIMKKTPMAGLSSSWFTEPEMRRWEEEVR